MLAIRRLTCFDYQQVEQRYAGNAACDLRLVTLQNTKVHCRSFHILYRLKLNYLYVYAYSAVELLRKFHLQKLNPKE
jgi:hypothetical protein